MRFLVTGGAGFIGSHIVERLLKDGHYVRVLDNFSSGKRENLFFTQYSIPNTQYELIEGDIRDYNTCLKACDGVDYILHQAALRSVPESLENPREYNEVNIDGTVNMLQAALEKKVKRFVLASSCSVYGDAKSFPQEETDPVSPISPYALTKLAGEHYCNIFSVNHGLGTVALRYFNVFGPRQSVDDEYAIVIPKFITCMLENKRPPIHGTGKQSRDFTYVENVVNANILAATRHCEEPRRGDEAISKPFCGTFNVGSGEANSILDLVNTLNKVMDKTIEPIFTPPRPGDVFKALADISKAEKAIGYKPSASFEEGLRITTKWFLEKAVTATAIL